MNHLTPAEIERWETGGADGDRARIVGHLAECEACAVLYEQVLESGATENGVTDAEVAALREKGYAAFRPALVRRRSMWRRVPVIGGAIAAGILLTVLVAPLVREATRDPIGDAALRGSRIQLLAPTGEVRPPVEFRWSSPSAASSYRVEVQDETGATVFGLESDGERALLPADRSAGLDPGREYRWVVIARDPLGDEIMRSQPAAFRVADAGR